MTYGIVAVTSPLHDIMEKNDICFKLYFPKFEIPLQKAECEYISYADKVTFHLPLFTLQRLSLRMGAQTGGQPAHLSMRVADRLARLKPQGQAKVSHTGAQVGLQQDVLTFDVPVKKRKNAGTVKKNEKL